VNRRTWTHFRAASIVARSDHSMSGGRRSIPHRSGLTGDIERGRQSSAVATDGGREPKNRSMAVVNGAAQLEG
jgi:hypothetical protein